MRLSLAVRRFDPAGEGRASTDAFDLDLPAAASVLDALLEAAETRDPSLAFRRMCRSGICGTCGMSVNGRPVLSCQVQVGEAVRDGVIEVEPLPNFRVLRDLVVDMDPFFDGLRRALPWLVANPEYDGRIAPARSEAMEVPATCVLCGICEADQPRAAAAPGETAGYPAAAYPAAGPAAWVKAYRFALDPRDALGATRLKVMADLGLVSEDALVRLARVCPKRIFLKGALDPGGPTVLEPGQERGLAGEE